MGLKAQVQHATFDSILPGLTTKKFDVGMSGFTDTKEREETVDFVTYFSAGTSFFVMTQEGGPVVNTLDDLCGLKLALQKGTAQVEDAAAQQDKCAAAGKPAIKVMTFPDQPGANLAIIARPRRRRHDRLARRRLPGQAVGRAALESWVSSSARRRTASRCPRAAALAKPMHARHEGPDRRRHLRRDPGQVRDRGRRDHTELNGHANQAAE